MSEKATLKYLKPQMIEIPTVRVTSVFDDDILQQFRDSIKEMGIVEPVIVGFDNEKFFIIDGLHRLEEAKMNNLPVVPCIVIPASQKEILLKNLTLNRLRGRTKASEMVKVVSLLKKEHQMTEQEIGKATGLSRDWIDELLKASEATEEVIRALDEEAISIGHAAQIARVKDRETQEKLLAQTLHYRLRVRDLRDVVDNTLKLIEAREKELPAEPKPKKELVNIISCDLCKQDKQIRFVQGFNVCNTCYTWATEYISKKLTEEMELRARMASIAEQVANPSKV